MNKSRSYKVFFVVLLYAIAFYIIQYFLYRILIISNKPTATNIDLWDGGWYKSISQQGYVPATADNKGNDAFYILFPWIWKLSHLGSFGISAINTILFAIGFTIIERLYPMTLNNMLVWLSIPSMFFYFVPYSEAIFFLLIAITLYGIVRNKRWVVWLGLFFVSWTRAVSIILLPAFVIMELITNDRKFWLKSLGNYFVTYALPLLMGVGSFIIYQYFTTGDWFTYFKLQSNQWGRKFAWPVLPILSDQGPRGVWLNALAFFTDVLAIIFIVRIFFIWLLRNKVQKDKPLMLSMLYLSAIFFVTVFCNPTWGTNHTLSIGLHRYSFATPFFYIFFFYLIQNRSAYRAKDYLYVIMLSNVCWLFFGSYLHVLMLLFFTFNTCLILLYMAHVNKKLSWPVMLIFAINVFLQIGIFQQFISNLYPD